MYLGNEIETLLIILIHIIRNVIIGIKTRGSCIENFVETWKRIFVFFPKRINLRIKILRALYFFTKRINVLRMLIRERNVHFLRFSANTINLVLDPFFFFVIFCINQCPYSLILQRTESQGESCKSWDRRSVVFAEIASRGRSGCNVIPPRKKMLCTVIPVSPFCPEGQIDFVSRWNSIWTRFLPNNTGFLVYRRFDDGSSSAILLLSLFHTMRESKFCVVIFMRQLY